MNNEEMEKAIERLKKVTGKSMALPSVLDIAHAFMGNDSWTVPYLRDALVDVLEKARSRWWVNNTAKEDLAESDDGSLANMGVMRLPVDRDGEIIRPGDMVDLYGEIIEVRHVKTCVGADSTSYYIICGEHNQYSVDPRALRHYREPTIKDVLRDFLSAVEEAKRKGYDDVPDEEYAECAERLREVMDA